MPRMRERGVAGLDIVRRTVDHGARRLQENPQDGAADGPHYEKQAGRLLRGCGPGLDLATLVVTARCARTVWDYGLAAARARDDVRGRDLVVLRPSHVSLRTALPSLGDSHRLLLADCVEIACLCRVLFVYSGVLLRARPRSGISRGSMPSSGALSEVSGLIPAHDSEHKGIMGIPSRISSRTKSSMTTVSPS